MIDTPRAPASGLADQHRGWPVLRSLQGYRPWFLTHDLIAGLTLAAIAIPEQLATARLGGFSPQIGFFAFLAGSLAFAVFGSNRSLSSGADSTITPIFAGGLALLAVSGSPEYAALAGVLALMVGVVLVAGGIFRLGWIADLLSVPVTVGFLAGISLHILISQLPAILGLPSPSGPMLERLGTLVAQLPQTNLFSLVIGLGVLALIVISERIDVRIPGALIGLVGAAAAVIFLGLESRGVTVLGNIPVALPKLAIPEVSLSRWLQLVALTLIVSIIVMVQTAATTRSFVSDTNEPPDVDRDFVGVGAGSILAGLIGAFPVNASPPRTAIVSETGRPVTTRRPRRRRHRSGVARIRKLAAASCPASSARRRIVIRCPEDHPRQPDRFDLPAIARRIPADRCDRRCHHHPSDRARGRDRNCALSVARHMEHDPRPPHGVRTGAGHLNLVATQSAHPRRERTKRHGRRLSGAVVVSQCVSFPARYDEAVAVPAPAAPPGRS